MTDPADESDVDDASDFEVVRGGGANANEVVRVWNHVLRPTHPHTTTIHRLIAHMRATGFVGVPAVVGIESDGHERLMFLSGDVPLAPHPHWSLTGATLASTTVLLRGFHDATVGSARQPATF